MRNLLILFAVCLTGCATNLITSSPPINQNLLAPCGRKIADPLTTADQYDLARALTQASKYGADCAKRQAELADAVNEREKMQEAVTKNIK